MIKLVKKILRTLIGNKKYAIAFLLLLIMIPVIILSIISQNKKRYEKENAVTGCTYSSEGFSGITDITIVNDTLAVFTNESGKKGIMTLDGTITEEASQDSIFVVSDYWRHNIVVAEGPRSEYKLYVNEETGKIDKKQYHGDTEPEKVPVYDEENDKIVWRFKDNTTSEIKYNELNLSVGLYPISTVSSYGSKYGYMSQSHTLEIATTFEQAGDFSCSLAAVCKGGKWGYINSTGNAIIPFAYESATSFKNNLAVVSTQGLFGIIDTEGNTVVDFAFDNLLQGENGKYIGKRNNSWCLVTVNQEAFDNANSNVSNIDQSEQVNGGNYIVNTAGSPLNLRANADTSSAVLTTIPNGTSITVTDSVPGWACVSYNSFTGWVSADYIKEISVETTAISETDKTQS